MKKLVATLFIFAIAITSAKAQLDFGIKAGVNFSERPTNIEGIKNGHTGWYAGPMLKYIFPVVGLGIEGNVLYSNSGANINDETFNKHSIEIPLYLRYELSLPIMKKIFIPFIAVGPQWGYTFGKKEFGNRLEEVDSADDIKELARYFKFKDSCFSLNVGVGFVLFKHLQIHANYNIALGETYEYRDIKNLNWSKELKNVESKNNIWQLSLAYIF